jgi:hypothetical protein
MNDVDLNIDNYTIGELIDIFDLDDDFTIDDVNTIMTEYIKLYKKNKSKKHINFLLKARNILLATIDTKLDDDDDDDDDSDDDNSIIENKNLTKREKIMNEEITFENTQIINEDIDNNDFIVKTHKEDIEKSHNLNIIRGNINPNLKNTINVLLNIDSQFRPDLVSPTSNYTFDLSEPLYKVTNYSLVHFEIQHSWYLIDEAYGTDRFYIDISGSNDNMIVIPQGNYSIEELLILINDEINNTYNSQILEFSYNKNTNKTTIINNDTNPIDIIFYDISGNYSNFNTEAKYNYNLGWILGYRKPNYNIDISSSLLSEGLIDLYGPKYLILCIDDFNNNQVHKGMLTMGENITKLKLPEYYTPDLSLNDPNFKFDFNTSTWVPSNLTEIQAYTIQEIAAERSKNNINRFYGPSSSNIFGRITLERKGGSNFSYVFNGPSNLKHLQRTFFGPVNIKRMNISLFNDKGQLMNLNNQNYSFALIVEQLYQY